MMNKNENMHLSQRIGWNLLSGVYWFIFKSQSWNSHIIQWPKNDRYCVVFKINKWKMIGCETCGTHAFSSGCGYETRVENKRISVGFGYGPYLKHTRINTGCLNSKHEDVLIWRVNSGWLCYDLMFIQLEHHENQDTAWCYYHLLTFGMRALDKRHNPTQIDEISTVNTVAT